MNFQKRKKELGKAIQTRRKSRNILQRDVADVAGISSRTLRDIEKGTANPELETLLSICESLGLEVNLEIIK
jgi:transcriptional regulator with XRE-family HTH domain